MSTKKKPNLKFQGEAKTSTSTAMNTRKKQSTSSPSKVATPIRSPSRSPSKAATPSPSKCYSSNETLIAYVHNLSKLQRNKKNTLDYATLTLQTQDEKKEALLYSKLKRPLLADSAESRTPIRIRRFALSADGKKLIFKRHDDHLHPTSNGIFLSI